MRASLVAAILIGAVSCGSDSSTTTEPAIVDVTASGVTFTPTILDVAVHTTVRWTFAVASDGFGHNVLFNPRPAGTPADISQETKSGSISRQFDAAGQFNYYCGPHGGMTGQVIVH